MRDRPKSKKYCGTILDYTRNLLPLRFECPYHGWTYSTSGRLTKAKRLKGIQDFSAKNFSLIPIAVQRWGPFIFINLSSKNDRIVSKEFAAIQSSIETEVGPFDQGMKFVKRVTYDVESNWKVRKVFFFIFSPNSRSNPF